MKLRNQKDLFSGVFFLVVGISFALAAGQYHFGGGAKMGPGYFPTCVGVLLALLGATILVKSQFDNDSKEVFGRIAWKPLICVILANFTFGACIGGIPFTEIGPLGLFPGIVLLTLLASYGGSSFRPKEALVLSAVLSIVSYLTFVLLLDLRFPLWPNVSQSTPIAEVTA